MLKLTPRQTQRHGMRHDSVNTHTHTHPFNGSFSGTRKVRPIWNWLKQETVSGSGISWAICKSAPRSRQITTPTVQHLITQVFYRPDALPAAQTTVSKHRGNSTEGSNSTVKQQVSKFYPHILNTAASHHIYTSRWPVIINEKISSADPHEICTRWIYQCGHIFWVSSKWVAR